MPVIQVDECWFEHRPDRPPVFQHLSFAEQLGETRGHGFLAVLGPARSGKSTLMRLLDGQHRATRGRVEILGCDAGRHPLAVRQLVAFVPQRLGLPADLTLREYLSDLASLDTPHATHRQLSTRVERAMAAVHLEDAASRRLRVLSGGMKRRAMLAQALLRDVRIVLVDAPTAGLDPYEQITVLALLREESRRRLIVMATSRPEDAAAIAGRLLLLDRGVIAADLATSDLATAAEGHVYEMPASFRLGAAKARAPETHALYLPGARVSTVRVVSDQRPHPVAVDLASTAEYGYLYLLWRTRRARASA